METDSDPHCCPDRKVRASSRAAVSGEGHEGNQRDVSVPAQGWRWARAGEPRPGAEWMDVGPARGSWVDHAHSDGWGRAGQTASSVGATNMWASVNLCVNK